jgi:negative regulator of flagellin synthesis FlgM
MSISKIYGSNPTNAYEALGKLPAQKGQASKTEPTNTPATAVRLSPLSEKLKSLSKDYASSGSFDEKRVEELKRAVANGTYKVNSSVVADRLIAEAKHLGSTSIS